MKLSTKIILPIIIISAMLILLNGCFGTVPDESPGFTSGTITGIIAAPCCYTSDEPVSETSGSPEYWCYYCEKDWNLQAGVKVILTSGQKVIKSVLTDNDGKFTFTNVPPGKNYVITAYCPDDEIPLVKDVALELIEGGSFDTKTTDLVSTSLGLVVDFVVYFAAWDPEDISLDEVIAAKPHFSKFPKFRKLIREVRRVLESCEDVDRDDKLLDALCKAAEEISKSDMGCAPGFTPEPEPEPEPTGGTPPLPPPPPPPPNLCAYNALPVITDPSEGNTIPADEGKIFTYEVKAEDNPSQALTFSLDKSSLDRGMTIGGTITDGGDASKRSAIVTWEKPECDCKVIAPTCSYSVTVTVEDVCHSIDTVTFIVEVTCKTYILTIEVSPPKGGTTVPVVGTSTHLAGTVVKIGAIPADHYEFDNWTGSSVADPNVDSTTVTMDANKTVTANFTPSSWTEEDGLRVAFEDLEYTPHEATKTTPSCNDWDYNDWVGDINIVYNLLGPDKLTGIDFTITHVARLAGYKHEFHLIIPGGDGGTYDLNGSSGNTLVAGDNDITIILDTSTDSGPYSLDIHYNSPFVDFDYNSYEFDPVNIHGEGLFFGPYLKVLDTSENIGKEESDIRMLTVPLGWIYPAGQVRIWTVYNEVVSDLVIPCPNPVFEDPFPGTWTP